MSFLTLLPVILIALGSYFLIKLRFFFILHPVATGKKMLSSMRSKSSRKSLALALAGTLGVGNIVGVAHGISVGGAGSVFWIFVSSVFASTIKYAEITLCRDGSGGRGMMYVLCRSFRRLGSLMGKLYAALCLALSLTMGSLLQAGSVVDTVSFMPEFWQTAISAVFTLAALAVIIGGTNKIEKITSILIPIATIVYIVLCTGIIVVNAYDIKSVTQLILKDAFGIDSVYGGVSAFLCINALREGFARGVLSNEAGAGTSAMAAARADGGTAGLLGICEVFFDTTLLCTLTGYAVLISGSATGEGMDIVRRAVFLVWGDVGVFVLFLIIFIFAYSTVICWYFYGSVCLRFLFGKDRSLLYLTTFILFSFVGYKIPSAYAICASDTLLILMTLLSAAALIKNSERIIHLSEKSGLLKNSDVGKQSKSRFLNK